MKPAFTSTSKTRVALVFLFAFLAATSYSSRVWADDTSSSGTTGKDRTVQPEEEDFTGTPYTEYGEFNEDQEEDANSKFFQYGRFFGVSLGVGYEGVTGNRGLLWQGGFPAVEFKVHYWFDFNFALDLGFYTANHFYDTSSTNGTHFDVNMLHVGVDLKYYFDTKNLSAPISFANPYIMIGAGAFNKTETSLSENQTDTDSALGLSAGVGLEFAIAPRKTYFELEGKYHVVRFKDTSSAAFQPAIGDLSGSFYTFTAGVLFTW